MDHGVEMSQPSCIPRGTCPAWQAVAKRQAEEAAEKIAAFKKNDAWPLKTGSFRVR